MAETIESFGAVGDLVFRRDAEISLLLPKVLTSASGTFTINDVDKVIVVNGAGVDGGPLITAIESWETSTEVTLVHSASTAIPNSSELAPIYYYGTDDTEAFRTAISAMSDADGGVILLDQKNYLITETLMLPGRVISEEQVAVIEFRGAIGPVRSNWNNADGIIDGSNDVVLPVGGQTIIQTSQAPPILQTPGKIFDVDWTTPLSGAPSGIQVFFENVVFRVPARSKTSGLDLQHAYSCRLTNVTIEPSDHQSNLPAPEPGTVGLALPRVGNGAQVVVRQLGIAGFDTGMIQSEHADLADIWFYRCRFALMASPLEHHAPVWGRIQMIWCPFGVISSNNEPGGNPELLTDGGLLDFEDAPADHWAGPIFHINDLQNYLRGALTHHRVVPFIGREAGLAVRGGAKLIRRQYGNLLADGVLGTLPFQADFDVGGSGNANELPPENNTGQAWMLTGFSTKAGVQNNKAFFSAGNAEVLARLEAATTEYIISSNITLSSTRAHAGLCVKYASIGNYIAATLEIHNGVNRLRLYKRDKGGYSNLGFALVSGLVLGTSYLLSARFASGQIEVFIDDPTLSTPLITYPLSDQIPPGHAELSEEQRFGPLRQFGLFSHLDLVSTGGDDGGSRWDDFSATTV